ncbi:MAG TPA: SDR family oxidoreductase [Phototrophicaceae bacterium]|nr:SDR family oxidoreductase [Phototrophicaceae bacterium]
MILVTGATGLSGSAVIRAFARHNTPVRALVHNRAKATAFEALPNVEIVEGDMLQPDTLGAALEGVERALMISTTNPRMVETQRAFIDAAKAAGVPHIIKFSGRESGIGFVQRNFRFMRMHEDIEQYLEASGLAWTHLQPSQFMQVYLREAPGIAAESAIYLPMGDAKISPIDVEDIAQIAYGLLVSGGHAGESLVMTGPEALTMSDVAERLSEALGKPIRYVNISREDARQRMLARGTPPGVADALDEQAAERQKCAESRIDLSAHQMFGVQPTSFLEFARRNMPAFSPAPAVAPDTP